MKILGYCFVSFLWLNGFSQNNSKAVAVWISTADQTKNLTRMEDVQLQKELVANNGTDYNIIVNENEKYQKWIGSGGCTNDASAWLIFKKLSLGNRNGLMDKLFDKKKGIGLDWVRHQMGSGDAAVIRGGWWTYDDMPKGKTDPNFAHFSIKDESEYILPMLKQARQLNKNLKIIGCPWTPPIWMKTSSTDTIGHNAFTYGEIKPEFYRAFTNYFVKFIKAYQAEGLPVYGISMQNEPLTEPGIKRWQGCKITAKTQADLIANYFAPAFKSNKIKTKIYCFDHNWDSGVNYVSTIYNNATAAKYVAGSMWHHYAGKPTAMTAIHNLYPNKEIWFTEGCAVSSSVWKIEGYEDFDTYEGSFMNFSWNVINVARNWCQTMMMYQIALDPNHGPAVFAPPTNYGMVTIDTLKHTIVYRPEYYTLGQISKFVKPGAYRIASNQYEKDVENVAFKNPDGSIALIVSNRNAQEKIINVKWNSTEFFYKIPPKSMITFNWN